MLVIKYRFYRCHRYHRLFVTPLLRARLFRRKSGHLLPSQVSVGELANRSSSVRVSQPCTARLDARIWIWITKNTLKLNLARFNTCNIYTTYKRVPVHWTWLRRTRDLRYRAARLNVCLLLVPNLNWHLATIEALVRNDRWRPKNKQVAFDSSLLLFEPSHCLCCV